MKLYYSVFFWQSKLLATVYLRWLLRILPGQPNYWIRDAIIETSAVVLTIESVLSSLLRKLVLPLESVDKIQ